MSSAAVLAVYAAGYVRTRPAADRMAERAYERPLARETPPVAPEHSAPVVAPPPTPPAQVEPKSATVATPAKTASAAITKTVPTPIKDAAPMVVETPAPAATAASPATTTDSAAAPAAEVKAEVSVTAPVAPAPPVWKDGKYTAWGTCRHGDIQATVVIESGRIMSAEITNCQTRYSCDVIETLPGKVVQRQKNKIDVVGGATESAYAYYGAVYWALDQASK